MTTLCDESHQGPGALDARTAWEQYPALKHAFGDFHSFQENLVAESYLSTTNALDWWRQLSAAYDRQLEAGALRLEHARYPISARGVSGLSFASRAGARLTLWLYGPIASTCVGERQINPAYACTDALREHHDASVVVLRIASPGGQLIPAKDLADAIKQHRGKTVAIVDSHCWSAAVVAATACDRVFVRQGATVMIHSAKTSAVGTVEDLEAATRRLQELNDLYVKVIARQRRISARRLARALPYEHFLSASEAVSFGLADDTVSDLPPFPASAIHAGLSSINTTRRSTMFEKSKVKAAQAALAKAETAMTKLNGKRAELDAATDKARAQLKAIALRIDGNWDAEQPLPQLETAMRQATEDKRKVDDWLGQLETMKSRLDTPIAEATLAILAAEKAVDTAAAEHYAAATAAATEKFLKLIREPLRELIAIMGGAEYFRALQTGRGVAKEAFSRVAVQSAWDGIGADVFATVTPEFYEGMEIGKPAGGGPNVEATVSPMIPAEHRRIADTLSNAGRLRLDSFVAALQEPAGAAKPAVAPDTMHRLAPGAEYNRYALEINDLEERIRRNRQRMESSGAPGWEKKELEQELAVLNSKLEKARTLMTDWGALCDVG